MRLEDKHALLNFIRLGIGYSADVLPESIEWEGVKALADAQGLSAIALDGLNAAYSSGGVAKDSMSKNLRLEWIGEVLQNYEGGYTAYKKAIGSLAEWYNQHGFKMMVLKGYACSLDWPNPKHRPCGDIDIWLFGQQKEADKCLADSTENVVIDASHHHHTVFYWKDFMVENYYDFINVHHHKSNSEFEKLLKEQGKDDSHYVIVNGENVYIPSPNLHALFLLKHACIEFAATGLNLRQLLDWAFFVKAHGKEVDWDWLLKVLEQFGMKTMFGIINAICENNLGFCSDIFPSVQYDLNLKDRVLNEIISPAIPNEKPKHLLPRMAWKYRRWKASEWKHKLCYQESMWSAFWSGVWGIY